MEPLVFSVLGCLIVGIGYYFVIFEEHYHIKKSISMMIAATVLWCLIGSMHILSPEQLEEAFAHEFLAFCQIFFFITVAMSYVLTLEDFGFFHVLYRHFSKLSLSARGLFWMTGLGAFFLSPFLDNLTTSLLLGQIFLSFAPKESRLIQLGLLNIVIAANAGGVFSPFGDLTSLMIWQNGAVSTLDFGYLFVPSLISYLIPASYFSWYCPALPLPQLTSQKDGAGCGAVGSLFFMTILLTVLFEHYLRLPAVFGMLFGLTFISLYERFNTPHVKTSLFTRLHRIDWDTLLFFYGIMLSIEGLKVLNILSLIASSLYTALPQALSITAEPGVSAIGHIVIGLLSAIIDNIPMMAAVLKMNLVLPLGSWLLLTLTTGIGGSLLSIGSAAGIALMGLDKKHYTFQSHFRWSPIILIGYAAGVISHCWLNAALFV